MAESIIGTVLLSASTKRNYGLYHLIFTDNRVLAIEAASAAGGGGNQANNPFSSHPMMGALAEAAIMGSMSRGGMGMNMGAPNQMARMQGMQRWQGAKAAAAGKPIIDYKQKTVTDEMLSLGNVSIPYAGIKQVTFKKELTTSDFNLSFGTGVISSETFVVQGDAASAIAELIKKTPLGAKLKQ